MTGKIVDVTAAQLLGTTVAGMTPGDAPPDTSSQELGTAAVSVYDAAPVLPSMAVEPAPPPHDYFVVVESDPDFPRAYRAFAPDFPGLVGRDTMRIFAVLHLEAEIASWLEDSRSSGKAPPTPTFFVG